MERIYTEFQKTLNREVQYEEIPSLHPSDSKNIKAIVFDGVQCEGGMTQVFAYYGKPQELRGGEQLPAILLIHGGGGHAFSNWVEEWNNRGYIAIAIDTVGGFPNDNISGRIENQQEWVYEIPECIAHRNGILGLQNDEMGKAEGKLEEQWMFHALTAAILAHNILKQDQHVDQEKIGVTGISWGGIITSLLMGYDRDFAFAIPVYGCGYMRHGLAPVEQFFYKPNVETQWLAEERFSEVKHGVLWVGSNDDNCFSVPPIGMSYSHTRKNSVDTRLSMIDGMLHSHEDGWAPREIGRYADAMIGSGVQLPRLRIEDMGQKISLNIELFGEVQGEVIKRIRLFYITEEILYVESDKLHRGVENLYYMSACWQKKECESLDKQVIMEIPKDTYGYYMEVITELDGVEYTSTTPYYR